MDITPDTSSDHIVNRTAIFWQFCAAGGTCRNRYLIPEGRLDIADDTN